MLPDRPGGAMESIDKLCFAEFCLRLEKASKPGKNKKKLALLFPKSRKNGDNLFPLLRLILPQADRSRRTYQLYQIALSKLYISQCGLNTHNSDARMLLNFKDPTERGSAVRRNVSNAAGDFGSVLETMLRHRARGRGDKTIREVNDLLDELWLANGKKAAMEPVIMRMINEYTAQENKWLSRIIHKELHINIPEKLLFERLHPDALQLWNVCTDLQRVCWECRSTSRVTPSQLSFAPLEILRPMLSKRRGYMDIIPKMGDNTWVIEPKYDGERLIVHKRGRELMMHTRRGRDYTDNYSTGVLDHWIHEYVKAEECILDGEVLSYSQAKQIEAFGSNRATALSQQAASASSSGAKGAPAESTETWLLYVVFDLLYLKGGEREAKLVREAHHSRLDAGCIAGLPLRCRRELLRKIIPEPPPKRLEIVREGIMLKDLESEYRSSTQKDWIKFKPDYADLTDDLDLIILGAYWGEGGHRRGVFSHFIVGVLHEAYDDTKGSKDQQFDTVCKVGGLNAKEMKELTKKLQPRMQQVAEPMSSSALELDQPKSFDCPSFVQGWKPPLREDVPQFWIKDPKDSIILEVQTPELKPSKNWTAGYFARFPRVKRIRDGMGNDEKPWRETMTRAQLHEVVARRKEGRTKKSQDSKRMAEVMHGSTMGRRAGASSGGGSSSSSSAFRKAKKPKFANCMVATDTSRVKLVADVLKGDTFLVYSKARKAEAEKQIVAHGGSVVQNESEGTMVLVDRSAMGSYPLKIQNY
eukprot:g1739.t1